MGLLIQKNFYIKAIRYLLLVAFVLFFILFFCKSGEYLILETQLPYSADAIILMGNIPDRALAAIDLYKKEKIHKIYVVDEFMEGMTTLREKGYQMDSNTEQMTSILKQAGVADSLIIVIPGPARSTKEEALFFRQCMNESTDIDTLIIISSAAHTRRAFIIFNHFLNEKRKNKIEVLTYPSPYSAYDPEKWYTRKEDIQTALSEYIKILSFLCVERWSGEVNDNNTINSSN